MIGGCSNKLIVDDAREADILAIAALNCTASLVSDYLRLAEGGAIRCLTLRCDHTIMAFALLVFRRPDFWPRAGDLRGLPEIVGLEVQSAHRSRGFGSAFLHAIEIEAAKAGHSRVYLTVSPVNNPRAHAFFLRHDYQPLQPEPYEAAWEMTDSHGVRHHGANWFIDMMKVLPLVTVTSSSGG